MRYAMHLTQDTGIGENAPWEDWKMGTYTLIAVLAVLMALISRPLFRRVVGEKKRKMVAAVSVSLIPIFVMFWVFFR